VYKLKLKQEINQGAKKYLNIKLWRNYKGNSVFDVRMFFITFEQQ